MASRNTIDAVRSVARSLGIGHGELLRLAREAEVSETLPDLNHMTMAGIFSLALTLRAIEAQRLVQRAREATGELLAR